MTIERTSWRRTAQHLAPSHHPGRRVGEYDIYPCFPLTGGTIERGYDSLAARLDGHGLVTCDGYIGVLWRDFRERLDGALSRRGRRASWTDVTCAWRSPPDIEALVEPFLGSDDPVFGRRFTGQLGDFFDPQRLRDLPRADDPSLSIVYGCGAALAGWPGLLVYVDVPKNEIQFRARAGSVSNLGCTRPRSGRDMYKRFYFVDWVALNGHKRELLPAIDILVDAQRPHDPAHTDGVTVRDGLEEMSRNVFRARPWFEPGPWGGQWIREKIPSLARDVPNYAWSFELITPENGLAFCDGDRMLEVSFDCLMYQAHSAVLGDCASRFGVEFPIRYDFLDTFEGGNLSLQCHPRPEYIREHFGESFTQDEAYYILDCQPGAQVYLGFEAGVDRDAFRRELEASFDRGCRVDVDRFVHREQAHRHDLFLIPSGTIHCSGRGNLVLEISATPYIYTFKMYDWLRLDLDGRPRPLNIARAFDNLRFDRQGPAVADLVARPRVLRRGRGWKTVHLPTHAEHFYDVHRHEFDREIGLETRGSCHVVSLVEGRSVVVETARGLRQRFSHAETFVIPAAAESCRLVNETPDRTIRVVDTFVKNGAAIAHHPAEETAG